MWRDVKAAYKSWWTQITMLLSAVAIFKFVTRMWGLELSDVMSQVVATYRTVFHPFIDFITLPFNLSLAEWQKDLVLIWLAIGGATARSHTSQFVINSEANKEHRARAAYVRGTEIEGTTLSAARVRRLQRSVRRALWAMVSILVWPLAWVDFFRKPFFYPSSFRREDRSILEDTIKSRIRRTLSRAKPDEPLFDMRVVLLVQVATVVAVVGALLLVNLIGLQ